MLLLLLVLVLVRERLLVLFFLLPLLLLVLIIVNISIYEYYCYESMRAIKHKHHVIAMFAIGKVDRILVFAPQHPRFGKPHPCWQPMSSKLGNKIFTVAHMSYRV